LETTLLAIPVSRPDPDVVEQHLSLDKGYSGEPCEATAQTQGYILHVPDKANAKKNASANLDGVSRAAGL
jgi:hypothetical protein